MTYQKEDFLLSDLLDDIKRLTAEKGLQDALIANTHTLKRKTAEWFLDFYLSIIKVNI